MGVPGLEILRDEGVEEVRHVLCRVAWLCDARDGELVRELRNDVHRSIVRNPDAVARVAEPGVALSDDHRPPIPRGDLLNELSAASAHLACRDEFEGKGWEQDGHGAIPLESTWHLLARLRSKTA